MGRPCRGRHWCVFADDTGDPGVAPGSSPFLGYSLVAVERSYLPEFRKAIYDFRVSNGLYGEMKFKPSDSRFLDLSMVVSSQVIAGQLHSAATMIFKERYDGPYLREWNGKPANKTWLRHYLVRHAIQLLFVETPREPEDHIDLVLDRDTWMSADRLENLQHYLNGKFNEAGSFGIPRVDYVTAIDSKLSEGLQVADHCARCASELCRNGPFQGSGAIANVECILTAQDFTVPPHLEARLNNDGRIK